jgi:hypothetical protein
LIFKYAIFLKGTSYIINLRVIGNSIATVLAMTDRKKHQLLNYFIATVWLVNGLLCKVLNLVPRHQEIVARILGNDSSRLLTILIGFSEIIMAIWILSRAWTRINAIIQILVIATMSTIEFLLVPDLLLWGRANAIFAFLFILLIYYNEFRLNKNLALQA